MAQRPLRFGVLGAGRIGTIHATNLATRVAGAEVAVIADVNLPAAETLARKLGVPRAVADYHDVLRATDVDAFAVCTPTSTHYQVIMDALAAGKPIFSEKPLDLDLAKIDAINAEVARRGVPLMLGFQRRYDPDFARIADEVRAGRIGDIQIVRITSRDSVPPPESFIPSSGGLFLDMTIHDLDMVRFVTGAEVTSVYARATVLVDDMFTRAGDWDTAVITLVLSNGALATIDNSRKTTYGYDQRLEVFGSRGSLSNLNVARDRVVCRDETGEHATAYVPFFPERYAEAYRLEAQAFVDAVRAGQPVPVTGHDGRQATIIARALADSARENRPVDIRE
ncbi:MAG TPA: inositol 2-dehydrogenase [Vicinamibacterales bacterium]|nr:inositol 2-dehydrogenase [Vicinamibacterales bacterium]